MCPYDEQSKQDYGTSTVFFVVGKIVKGLS